MSKDGESKNTGGQSSNDSTKESSKETFTPHDIDRVAVRLPPFWPEKPAVWFAQIEGSFTLSGIKEDSTKYYYVISLLDQRYAAEVEDIICKPPEKDKYDKLKTELIKRLSLSREKEVKQLLLHEELGDRRPSHFLRHLQQLAGPNVPEDFIKSIWASRLPVTLQTVVAGRKSKLDELAELADQVFDIVPSSHVAATSTASTSSSPAMEKMASEIAALTRQVKALSSQVNIRSRPRQRNSSNQRHTRNSSQSRTRSQSSYRKFPVCFYHYKHGENARKCLKPCDYQGNGQGGR